MKKFDFLSLSVWFILLASVTLATHLYLGVKVAGVEVFATYLLLLCAVIGCSISRDSTQDSLDSLRGKYHALYQFVATFVTDKMIQDLVDRELHNASIICEIASQEVIKLQNGGLKSLRRTEGENFDDVYARAQMSFASLQTSFYRKYDAAELARTSIKFPIAMRERKFKAYLDAEGENYFSSKTAKN